METIAGFPFFKLDFTKDGAVDAADHAELSTAIGNAALTDLLVLSHGWNNDTAEARALYEGLLSNLRAVIERNHGSVREIAVVGILWPSKRFTDDALRPDAKPEGHAASVIDPGFSTALLAEKLDRLSELLGGADPVILDRAKASLDNLEDRAAARSQFVEALRAMLPRPSDPYEDNSDRFFNPHADDDILRALAEPVSLIEDDAEAGGAAHIGEGSVIADPDGCASSLADFWNGVKGGAWRLLNYTTYYVMKERAGVVGTALNGILAAVRDRRPDLHIHLAGHSFGARLVTAAVAGPTPFRPQAMALLQGAFSHNGFARDIDGKAGFFRSVVANDRVAGPIIATHTRNDKAVGIAYAIASRFSGDQRSAVGGPDDKYGGIGRNGAMRMGNEATAATLEDAGFAYPIWAAGRITNLLADRYISDHSDVTGAEVANALFAAMRLPA